MVWNWKPIDQLSRKRIAFHIFIIILTLRMIIHILDSPLTRGVVYRGDFLKKSMYIYIYVDFELQWNQRLKQLD